MENLWKGWIIDESINDATLLSSLNVLDKRREENTEGDVKRVWTLFTVEVEDTEMKELSQILEKEMKKEYYAHFTNGKKLWIIFHGKSFVIRLKKMGEDKGFGITIFEAESSDIPLWRSAFEYGTTKGKVDSRYLITVT